jgi:hypothetical protein
MTLIVRNLISESVEWKRLSKITGKELSAVFRAAEKDVDECKSERQEKQRLITRLRDHTHLTQLTLTTMTRELTLSSHRPTQPATVTNECNFNDEICCFCKFSDLNYILVCRRLDLSEAASLMRQRRKYREKTKLKCSASIRFEHESSSAVFTSTKIYKHCDCE